MKIPLQWSADKIVFNTVITSQTYRTGGPKYLQFVVDTGSGATFISQGDAMRLGIPIKNLTFYQHVRMAGSVFELKKIGKIKLKFKNDEEKLLTMDFDNFYVALSTKKDQKSKSIADTFPSILGVDFMRDNLLTLVLTPHKKIAYFEK